MKRKKIKIGRALLLLLAMIITSLYVWGGLIAFFAHYDFVIGILSIIWFISMFSLGYVDDVLTKGLK